MKKLFIVTSNPTTVEQDKVFQAWISSKFAWWHWMNQTWLLIDEAGVQQATEIATQFHKSAPGTNCMVFELTPTGNTWAGFGPNKKDSDSKDMFDWIRRYWKF